MRVIEVTERLVVDVPERVAPNEHAAAVTENADHWQHAKQWVRDTEPKLVVSIRTDYGAY